MKNRKISTQIEKDRCLDFYGLEELCDDPKRNETKKEVHAVLTPVRSSFALSAVDGDQIYKIIDGRGRQVHFKTIDRAMERLSDVPHLWPEIVIDASACFRERASDRLV